VVQEAETPDYYIMLHENGVTHFSEWSGALNHPSVIDALAEIVEEAD
jgi:hypothetical protein